jgi:hypothetical protein
MRPKQAGLQCWTAICSCVLAPIIDGTKFLLADFVGCGVLVILRLVCAVDYGL